MIIGNGQLTLPQLSCVAIEFYHTSAGVNLHFLLHSIYFWFSHHRCLYCWQPGLDVKLHLEAKAEMLDKKRIRLQPHVVLLCNDAEDFDEQIYVAFSVITSDLLHKMPTVVAAVVCSWNVPLYSVCNIMQLHVCHGYFCSMRNQAW